MHEEVSIERLEEEIAKWQYKVDNAWGEYEETAYPRCLKAMKEMLAEKILFSEGE